MHMTVYHYTNICEQKVVVSQTLLHIFRHVPEFTWETENNRSV